MSVFEALMILPTIAFIATLLSEIGEDCERVGESINSIHTKLFTAYNRFWCRRAAKRR